MAKCSPGGTGRAARVLSTGPLQRNRTAAKGTSAYTVHVLGEPGAKPGAKPWKRAASESGLLCTELLPHCDLLKASPQHGGLKRGKGLKKQRKK